MRVATVLACYASRMEKPRSKKVPWSQPLGELVGAAIHPVLAQQGFGESAVVLNWAEIVGPRLAANSEPLKLQWRRRAPGRDPEQAAEPATLLVRVEGGFALELQHMSGIVVERVNAHLGWRCVGRIALRQGPLARRPAGRAGRRPASTEAVAAAAEAVAGVSEEALRAALVRLGAQVIEGG